MFKTLLKKQLTEVFRGYFYDAKKNKMRSKGAVIGFILLFGFIILYVGASFVTLSLSLCEGLLPAGCGSLYFLIMGTVAVMLGSLGSMFSTFTSLYLAKDNDLLLSMPIPVATIIAARLTNVYILSALYSAIAFFPALGVYWYKAGITAASVLGGVMMYSAVTFIVLIISCALGRLAAAISVKFKNKSYFTVTVALVFIGVYYYFIYVKAPAFFENIMGNAASYGEKLKNSAYLLYRIGRIAEGDIAAAVIFLLTVILLLVIVGFVLSRGFLKIASFGGKTGKVRASAKKAKERSVFSALLGKEFARFTSSANYMLNCGFGLIMTVLFGVVLLIKGGEFVAIIGNVFTAYEDAAAAISCAAVCIIGSMNYIASPSVSLEGKSIWIPQSLPVDPKTVLRAKAAMQFIINTVPAAFASACAAIVINASLPAKLLAFVTPLFASAFTAAFDTAIGVKMPVLTWTSEIVPIKQSGAIAVSLFGGLLINASLFGPYFIVGSFIGASWYLSFCSVVYAAAAVVIFKWLDKKGAAIFARL